jgi:hypothetical protein
VLPASQPSSGLAAWKKPKWRAMRREGRRRPPKPDAPADRDTAMESIERPTAMERISRTDMFRFGRWVESTKKEGPSTIDRRQS